MNVFWSSLVTNNMSCMPKCVLIGPSLTSCWDARNLTVTHNDMWMWERISHASELLNSRTIRTKGELDIMLCYRQSGSCPWRQFLPNRSCSLNCGSKPIVLGCAEILLQAWVFLLMGDSLLLARWKRSSNKCGPIYHPQHITGELGVIIHAGRGMNRPFRGSWAQTLKRASPSSFSIG